VTSIPVKISIEFDRKAKVQSIIDAIKNLKELELEKNNFYTYLILLGYNLNFIDTELKIDECFQNNQTIDIYEFLNHNGLNEIIWNNNSKNEINYDNNSQKSNNLNATTMTYETEPNKKNSDKNCTAKNYENNKIMMDLNSGTKNNNNDIININNNNIEPINYETLKNFKLPILDFNWENKDKKFEYFVEINHRFITEKELYIFNQANFNLMHNFFFDGIIMNNSVN